MKRLFLGAVVATATAVVAACVGDSAAVGAGAAAGSEHGACFANGTCIAGLQCVDMVCLHIEGGAAGVDAGPAADASSPVDGSSFTSDSGGTVDSGLTLQNDPDNCGTAGHKCPTGRCAQGDCYKRMFVSSVMYQGNLAGVAGTMAAANQLCQDLANAAAGFSGGIYKAWISVDAVNQPATTFTKSKAPYVRQDGMVVANDWAGLTTQALVHDPGLTETAAVVGAGKMIWTNTNNDGTVVASGASATNCFAFSSSSPNNTGAIGIVGTAKPDWSYVPGSPENCINAHSIYCFEQ